jgi:hypothetical protein
MAARSLPPGAIGRRLAIIDLDGTVSDDRHRRYLLPHHLIPPKQSDFKAYHSEYRADKPMNIEIVRRAEKDDLFIVFITGRPAIHLVGSVEWIKEKLGVGADNFLLLMRPDDDATPSPILKLRLFEEAFGDNVWSAIQLVADDREDVLAAFCEVICRDWNSAAAFIKAYGLTFKVWSKPETLGKAKALPPEPPPQPPQPAAGAPAILRAMAQTFEERSVTYRDNFRMVGPIMGILFPDGVPLEVLSNPAFHLFELKIVKLTRFAISNLKHLDSIHDDGVYSAMIEAIIQEGEQK